MDSLEKNHEQQEREKSLQKIKEYILSLIIKKKKRQEDKKKEPIRKEIEDVLESATEEELKEKEEKTKKEEQEETKKEEQEETEEKAKEQEEKKEYTTHPEDSDECQTHDMESGEAMGETASFADIYPPFLGYYSAGKNSYFDRKINLWSKKKKLSDLKHHIPKEINLYGYAGNIGDSHGHKVMAIPLPDNALPETSSLCFTGKTPPIFKIDQNNCIYLITQEQQYISFNFALQQTNTIPQPVKEDKEKIIFDNLSTPTQKLMESLQGRPPLLAAQAIKRHIISTKKYIITQQEKLRAKSNSNNYIKHLDESPILECMSANILFVALCRELGIATRLCTGHMVQSVSKNKKASLNRQNGHARSEIRDEEKQQWKRMDATPTEKEEKDKKDENKKDEENQNNNQDEDNNFDDDQEGEEKEGEEGEKENKKKQQGKPQEKAKQKQKNTFSEKSPGEMLDEFIEKAKEDNLTQQAEQMQEILDKLEQAKDKKEMKKILDESKLEDFAKDMVDKIGNQWILEEEKKELENLTDEKEIEKKLKDSLLSDEYKEKLKEYAKVIKDKIEEEKKRMKSEMERYGFKEAELHLYKMYKELEREVEPQVRKQIAELQKLLPPNYQILKDDDNFYRSWYSLDRNKLVNRKLTGDNKIFIRNKTELDTSEINMFETIIIDKSGSMWSFNDSNSPFRNAIKAAIIRAKVLEHFKVQMSIVVFGDKIEEVMSFGEQFSNRSTKIPSNLMRIATSGGGWNSQEPMTYVYSTMKKKMRDMGGKSFGNISFIGDGDLYSFQEIPALKALIQDLKKSWFGVTAYYVNNAKEKMPLIEYYFWSPEDGGAVYAKDVADLSQKIVNSHRTRLLHIITKFIKR